MRDLSAAMQTILASAGNTLVRCWEIATRRGTVLGFTKHTRDVTVNGLTFQSLWGIRDNAIETSEGFAVGNQELTVFLSKLDTQAIEAGVYDHARIRVFDVDPQNLAAGEMPHKVGMIGNTTRRDGHAVLEMRGPAQLLQAKIGEVYTVSCPVRLGSARCKVELHDVGVTEEWVVVAASNTLQAPGYQLLAQGFESGQVIEITNSPTNDGVYVIDDVTDDLITLVSGPSGADETAVFTVVRRNGLIYKTMITSVDTASPRRIFTTDTLLDAQGNPPAAGWFHDGNVTWVTGDNVGTTPKDIRSHAGAIFTLYDELPYDVQVGDELLLEVGCNKRFKEDCIDKFDNGINFQGFPLVPTPEEVFDSPVTVL